MSRHETDVRLRHMLDAAREAAQMAHGRTRADLDTDRPLNLSLVRLLEVVGEAASRVPIGERPKYTGIPWVQIVGLRNRLIHGYDNVDFDHPLGNHRPRFTTADHRIGKDTIVGTVARRIFINWPALRTEQRTDVREQRAEKRGEGS